MKRTTLELCLLLLANYEIVNSQSQFASQIFQKFLNRPAEIIIDNCTPTNIVSNRPIEIVENYAYQSNGPIEIIENVAYSANGIINPSLEIVDNVYTNVINEPLCNGVALPVQEYIPSGQTILITDCSPSACQNLADTLNLMIVCNMLQNTQGGKEYALKLAGPVINQLISSPVLSCGCPNPVFPVSSNPICPNSLPNMFSPSFVTSEIVSPNLASGPIFDLTSNLVSVNNAPSCSCQTLSGTVSSCPCQACAAESPCSCLSFPLFPCQKCLATSSCQKCPNESSCSCQKSSAPTCPCQACSSSAFSIPPPPPALSCTCQACTACPNNLINAPSCSCQTLSGTVSSCPCQVCAAESPCSCLSFSLFPCQKCLASSPCQKCPSTSSCSCQKCPAPTCPCQACSSSASLIPPPPPVPSCTCQACTACPNNLNSMLSSFLSFL